MKRAVRRALLLSALAAPSALYALGLGEIRLNSALNQPFDAEIELVSAAPEDLAALRAALASNDTFQRYGLEKASYLADFTFRVARSGGRDVLRVTSPRPVSEPFVTLLVEASWPRGRLLREYTVLLDPPAFSSAPAATVPAATPRAAATTSAAPVPPPVTEPAPQPAAPASTEAATRLEAPAIEAGSTYRVQPNDTLSGIASAASDGSVSEINRTMVAIYEANPNAFAGNINVLRSGSDLRIPSSSEVAAISASAAAAEVARQYQLWSRGAVEGAPAAETSGRLRLVTPEQGGAAPSSVTEAPAAGVATDAELRQRLARLEAELAETRRLLEVRNAELATLQGSAAAVEAPQPAAEATSPPVPVPDAAPGEMTAEEGPAAEAAAPEPAAVEAPTPEPKPTPSPAAAPEPQPTLLDRLRDYAWALLALLAAGLGLAFWLRRRRSSGSPDERLEETLGRGASAEVQAGAAVAARSGRHADHVDQVPAVAVAAPAAVAAAAGGSRAAEPPRAVTVADTLSGDGAISIEAGDPLAEADFHMAYGLYDQAADLVQLALNREPHRRDLKLKLVEVFFVWGNRERFVELARGLHATRGQAEPGEWDKVLIMGRQLAPEEPMFAAAPSSSAGALDLELHDGAAPTDFELPGGEAPPLDVDLGALGPTVRGDDSVDFLIDEPVRGRGDEESALAPTVETPRVRRAADEPTAEVPTAELPIEDLGLDASDLAGLEELAGFDAEPTRTRVQVDDTVQEPALRRAGQADDAEPDLMSATSMLTVDLAALSEAAAAAESNTVNLDLAGRTAELATIELEAVDEETAADGGELGPLEEITMSEIGTKLDLARAYVDMGDPEGARSILEEVIKEGTGAHKQEAERLMVGLP